MNVSLPDDLVDFVRHELDEGGYGNQSDVVREGLRLLRNRKLKQRVLTSLLEESRAAVAQGKTQELTDELLTSLRRVKTGDKKRSSENAE